MRFKSTKQLLTYLFEQTEPTEGSGESIEVIRKTLQDYMSKDQGLSKTPDARKSLQDEVWPYIMKNIDAIMQDRGLGNGDCSNADMIAASIGKSYKDIGTRVRVLPDNKEAKKAAYEKYKSEKICPASFSAWLLVQHMDANPERQEEFLNHLFTNHVKYQFLKDRANVNQMVVNLAGSPPTPATEEELKGMKPELAEKWKQMEQSGKMEWLDSEGNPIKDLGNPTNTVRSGAFSNTSIPYSSAKAALAGALKHGNLLLYRAVKAAHATTQPSYNQAHESYFDVDRWKKMAGILKG